MRLNIRCSFRDEVEEELAPWFVVVFKRIFDKGTVPHIIPTG